MFSRIRSAVCAGMEGREVFVETDIARGLPGISIVGLASTMIKESKDRIKSAIVNTGREFPRGRITVNLTPASLHKSGSCLDLPIAVGILAAGFEVDAAAAQVPGIIGELALDGSLLRVNGILPMIMKMKEAGIRDVIVPRQNAEEAGLISDIRIYPVSDLAACIDLLSGRMAEPGGTVSMTGAGGLAAACHAAAGGPDFSDIAGQENAKRAITIAAAGRHGLLMVGSPGCGKSMLASRIPTVMPPMSENEALEAAMVLSVTGRDFTKDPEGRPLIVRPFRSPHHTIGKAGLVGGGNTPVPGEITLAHNGVLFLDEICEFDKAIIETLRIPMEERRITHFRRGEARSFPCDFQLVMAANPCPCGYYGDPDHLCRCSQSQLEYYRRKLSGPIIDRVDMRISMEKVKFDELQRTEGGREISSADMRAEVTAALDFADGCGRRGYNALLSDRDVDSVCRLDAAGRRFMKQAYEALNMSPRSYKKTLRVARTIADLDGSEDIHEQHLAEALSYRTLDHINE